MRLPASRAGTCVTAAFLIALCVLVTARAQAQETAKPWHRILMLYSESADQPASMMIDSAFRAAVAHDTARHVVIYSEYLDQSRYPDAQTQSAHQAWLREKYRGRNLRAVVAIGGLAVSTMMAAETTIAPGIPLVVWVNEHAGQRWMRPNAAVTGVVVQHDVSGTVRDALTLFPGTRELVVVSGSAPGDSLLLLETRNALRPFQDRLSVRYLVGLSQAGLERETAVLLSLRQRARPSELLE